MLIVASLIFLGILLLLVEMLLIPGVGVAGILALGALGTSCWYAFTYMSTKAGILVTVAVILLCIVALFFILRAKTWKRFELNTVIDSKVNQEGELVKIGDKGVTATRLAPMGKARFEKTSCEVRSEDNSMVDAGVDVEVSRIEDNKVYVKPINQ